MKAQPLGPDELADAVLRLQRPLPGDMAALYHLRVARSGGLRLALLTHGSDGRLTISEPFGSAVSLTSWDAAGSSVFYDMREGCRREIDDLEEVLGVGALPLGQAARLLGGRLPVSETDHMTADDGRLAVQGPGWAAVVRVLPDPWRVVEVRESRTDGARGWRLELDDHTSSVPGKIRLEHDDGRWAELELTRLEWPEQGALPDLPPYPPCDGSRR